MKTVLVTGANGFLGRNVVRFFKSMGYRVLGIGRGRLAAQERMAIGLDYWLQSDITLDYLTNLQEKIQIIVHCAGGSSVGKSFNDPYGDFTNTVVSSVAILEYIRLFQPTARLVYVSSAAVYGSTPDEILNENRILKPVSPYGINKKIVEELCISYVQNYAISVHIVRFFSIFGSGLKKQLFWDACNKFISGKKRIFFWGTGEEIRDWIHVNDAVDLIYFLTQKDDSLLVVNGGSGVKRTNFHLLNLLAQKFPEVDYVEFNQKCREGDPKYYCADVTFTKSLGWEPKESFEQGINDYVEWFRKSQNL